MTNLPKSALVAALLLGTSLVVASPALAKKKPDPAAAQGPQLNLSPAVRAAQAGAVGELGKVRTIVGPTGAVTAANQAAVIAAIEAAEPFIASGEAAAQNDDERYILQEIRYRKESVLIAARFYNNPAQQQSGNVVLGPALDKLLANPVTPAASVKEYAMDRARMQYLSRDYRPALANLQRARAAGSTDPLLGPLIVDTYVKLGDYGTAASESDKMIVAMKAAGQPVPEAFYAIGIENAYRSKNPAGAIAYEQKRLADYPDPKNFHDAVLRLMTRSNVAFDVRQRVDAYRLLRAAKALADEKERQNYAADATDIGASREAVAILEEFRAGRPVTALDPATRKLLSDAQIRAKTAASPAAAEATARASSDAQTALTAANYNYTTGNFAKAAELYQLAQQRGAPDKDAVLLSLGAAQAQSGDKAGAQASFAAIQSSPRKEIGGYWQIWLAKQP